MTNMLFHKDDKYTVVTKKKQFDIDFDIDNDAYIKQIKFFTYLINPKKHIHVFDDYYGNVPNTSFNHGYKFTDIHIREKNNDRENVYMYFINKEQNSLSLTCYNIYAESHCRGGKVQVSLKHNNTIYGCLKYKIVSNYLVIQQKDIIIFTDFEGNVMTNTKNIFSFDEIDLIPYDESEHMVKVDVPYLKINDDIIFENDHICVIIYKRNKHMAKVCYTRYRVGGAKNGEFELSGGRACQTTKFDFDMCKINNVYFFNKCKPEYLKYMKPNDKHIILVLVKFAKYYLNLRIPKYIVFYICTFWFNI